MKQKQLIMISILLLILIIGAISIYKSTISASQKTLTPTITSTVRFVNSSITADGAVVASNQARLTFQTSGKLTYLPFKEGDKVRAGQTIAKLDNYALQRQLTTALNNYKTVRNTFDQTQQNSEDNVLKTQIAPTYTKATLDNTSVVNDALNRILDQNQATLDNSVINVELANYSLQLSSLSSPISGVLTHQDVNVAGLNVTPATSFTVSDLDSLVFRANIPTSNIFYVSLGSHVSLVLDGLPEKFNGTVIKIYPTKVVLTGGQTAYQVDIASDALKTNSKLDQSGKAIISTNSENVALVPAWTVLSGKYIWVNEKGTPQLKEVTIGKLHNSEVEIISGLSAGDQIIVDPKYISSLKYTML